jgi:hypothetical protein
MKSSIKFYFIIALFLNQLVFCQETKEEARIIALGLLKNDKYLGESIDTYNCGLKYLNEIKQGEILVITGIKDCISEKDNQSTKFYEVKFNEKYLFIEVDFLKCEKDYYQIINNFSEIEKNNFRENSAKVADIQRLEKLKKFNEFIKHSTQQGLIVKKWKIIDESEYTDGTSVEIDFINPTKKTIKYIWTTFVGYNAVEDPVIDRMKGVKNITVKSIGPIKPDESGLYTYEYVWYTDIVETAKITNIKIQYMDGTFKTITAPDKVIMSDSLLKILEEQD